MRVSLNWLSEYIEIESAKMADAEEIAGNLSNLGLPCEGIEHFGDDIVIDVEVTSNRGDCLSLVGIARELAAATGRRLKLPSVDVGESDREIGELVSVEIAEPDLCGRYTARVVEGVRVGPSPGWMVRRLEAAGLRSVNNVVDATNYAMIETGQPPHAFDYVKIAQGRIIVRRAMAGERIVSIDGTVCELEPQMLIIADATGPVAVAGVMGGRDTEVGDRTTTILLEDAYFDPLSVRRTSRRLGLASEASFRFERSVDIEAIDCASKRTAQLIAEVAGGRLARGVVDVYPGKKPQKQAPIRLSRLNELLGVEIAGREVMRILSALGFKARQEDGVIVCSVPSWRSDVYREADLIEEVARVYGYGRIPAERKIEVEVVPVDKREKTARSISAYLNACGFYEAITVGFVENGTAALFSTADVAEHLAVRDESRKSVNLLRQTLIGSLLGVLKTNLNAGNSPCRIFEIADTFVPAGGEKETLPNEEAKLALVCDGEVRDLWGVIEGLIRNLDRDAEVNFRPARLVWAQTGAEIVVNGNVLGMAGVVSQRVSEKFDFRNLTPVAAELEFERLLAMERGGVKARPIARFPAIERDLSIIVDEQARWADIVKAVKQAASAELEDIQFVEIYRGKGISAGRKSVTLSLRFRDEDGTLTHEVVDDFQARIVKNLAESVGAELRTI